VWESGRRRYLSYVLGTNTPLVALTPSPDLFVCAKDLFDGANSKTRRALSAASLLADQQDKCSGTYQQGSLQRRAKQPNADWA
jgi:hypothetical protein